MSVIYHVEHGDTLLDKQNKVQGLMPQGLTDSGRMQMRRAVANLKGKGIKCVYCSPLPRSKQSAEIIAKALGADLEVRQGLLPVDIGSLAGKKTSDARPYLQFFGKRPTLPFPNGETVAKWYQRAQAYYKRQFAEKMPVVAVVGHSRDHQLLQHWKKNGIDAGPEGIDFCCEPGGGQVTRLERSGNSISMRKVA
jgi:probable phosphoglycerate mutase